MKLSDFKKEIRDLLEDDTIILALDLLENVTLVNKTTTNNIVLLRSTYKSNKKFHIRGTLNNDDYQLEINGIKSRSLDLLDDLSEEDFIPNWFEVYSNQTDITEEEVQVGSISNNFDEIVQVNLEELNLSKEDVQLYKKLLLNCQDSIGVGDFDSAKESCLKAKEYDPTSPQIYQYLAQIYFEESTTKSLIENALINKKNDLRHIIQYAKRFNDYKEKRYISDGEYLSQAETNIQTIGHLLTLEIKKKYFRDRGKYYGKDNKQTPKPDEKELQESTWRLLNYYNELFVLMGNPDSFLLNALVELSGAGIINWFYIGKEEPKNRYPEYNALELRKSLVAKYTHALSENSNASSEELLKEVEDKISNKCEADLKRRYGKISPTGDEYENSKLKKWDERDRYEMIRYFAASKICYKLFDEATFLQQTKLEISQKDSSGIFWIDLNDKGKLKTHASISYLRKTTFDSLTELKYISEELSEDYLLLKDELEEELYLEKKNYTYNQIGKSIKFLERSLRKDPDFDTSKIRKELAYQIRNLRLIASKENDPSHIEKALSLLLNTNGLEYVSINKKGRLRDENKNDRRFPIKAPQIISEFLQLKSNVSDKLAAINEDFFTELFEKNLAKQEKINQGLFFDGTYIYERKELIHCMENFELCFLAMADPKYLAPALEELQGDHKLNWTSKTLTGEEDVEICQSDVLRYKALEARDKYLIWSNQSPKAEAPDWKPYG